MAGRDSWEPPYWAPLAATLGATAAAAGGSERSRYAYEQAEETSHGIAANLFKERLEEASGGALALAVYPAGQLGGEPALLQKVLTQDIDFINSSTANASLLAPQSGVFSLHYLFDSPEHALKRGRRNGSTRSSGR